MSEASAEKKTVPGMLPTQETAAPYDGLLDRLRSVPSLFRRRGLMAAFSVGLVVAAILLVSFTYMILTGLTPLAPSRGVVVALLLGNLAIVLTLSALIFWRIARIILDRRSGAAGARLHSRLIGMFSLVAVMPAIIVAVFATVTLNRGLDIWFSERTRVIIGNAQEVAQSYLREHKYVLRSDIMLMNSDLSRVSRFLDASPARFQKVLATQAALRSLPAAYIVSRPGVVLTKVTANVSPVLSMPTDAQFEQAAQGDIVLFTQRDGNQICALVALGGVKGAYLLVARFVDARVLEHLARTEAAVSEYASMEGRRVSVQVTFALIYIAVALVVLLAAIWLGLWAANRMVEPIGELMAAAERVRAGELGTRVDERGDDDEMNRLGRAFNRMTSRIETQRNNLIRANSQLDERRRFTEAVLSGVSAGVIGLNSDCHISHMNRAARNFLGVNLDDVNGCSLESILPEMNCVVQDAVAAPRRSARAQLSVDVGGHERNLNVRVTGELSGSDIQGYVVTFDDITELVAAQRNAAWADIARRIAHEIKNPLTPIQLSAERLRRKYGKIIGSDQDVFNQCTDTIIRQVGDIGRMVDEFSSFARMPEAVIKPADFTDIIRQSVFLQRVAHSDIKYRLDSPDGKMVIACDERLVSQAMMNILKNAAEAIEVSGVQGQYQPPEGQGAKTGDSSHTQQFSGHISIVVKRESGNVSVIVTDTGCGLPEANRYRLLEPHTTTREKGTGLGLAIVKKVMEDHGGLLELSDAPVSEGWKSGARVTLVFPVSRTGESNASFSVNAGKKKEKGMSQSHEWNTRRETA